MSTTSAFEHFNGLGTTIAVGAADPVALPEVIAVVRAEVDACDRACSRFRADSELARINAGERLPAVSEWLCEATATALDAARLTDGLVDPTIGQCLIDLGYDRTFDLIDPSGPLVVTATHVPAWRQVRVDRAGRRVTVPARVRLDLGATAKALCADRAAAHAARLSGTGVLVSLGGDIAVAGEPPAGGWSILVTDRADTDCADTDRADTDPTGAASTAQTVSVVTGGLATSGTAARRWARAGAVVHHLVDPRTGRPAAETWRTVSVAAPSCVAANTASTAAMILGPNAPAWLERHGYDARMVTPAGVVVRTGGWPHDAAVERTDAEAEYRAEVPA